MVPPCSAAHKCHRVSQQAVRWVPCLVLECWLLTQEREWDVQLCEPGPGQAQGALSHRPAQDPSPNLSELEAPPLQEARLDPGAANSLVSEPAQKRHRRRWNPRAASQQKQKAVLETSHPGGFLSEFLCYWCAEIITKWKCHVWGTGFASSGEGIPKVQGKKTYFP